jgi:hypothetical protein
LYYIYIEAITKEKESLQEKMTKLDEKGKKYKDDTVLTGTSKCQLLFLKEAHC